MKTLKLLALALFASASVFAVGCGETATTSTAETETTSTSETQAASSDKEDDHAGHEHTMVSLKLPGMT